MFRSQNKCDLARFRDGSPTAFPFVIGLLVDTQGFSRSLIGSKILSEFLKYFFHSEHTIVESAITVNGFFIIDSIMSKCQDCCTMKKSERFERKFIEMLLERFPKPEEGGKKRIAEDAFPTEQTKPDQKIQRFIKPDPRTGKTQRVTLADAFSLTEVLKIPLPDFIWGVLKALDTDETELMLYSEEVETPEVRRDSA